jgi:hypothetical protein
MKYLDQGLSCKLLTVFYVYRMVQWANPATNKWMANIITA